MRAAHTKARQEVPSFRVHRPDYANRMNARCLPGCVTYASNLSARSLASIAAHNSFRARPTFADCP
jgi:hypothetical protein